MSDRLTLATSTGLPFVALAFHVAAGTVALAAGWVAMVARKGGTYHRRSGHIYVCAMIAMGLMAVGISVYESKESIAGGALAGYFVFTAWTTVRPLPQAGRQMDFVLMALAWVFAASGFAQAFTALGKPGHQVDGVPAGMQFFMSTIVLLAAIGDVRMIRAGSLQGAQRLARHLWRMCFGLFIATGSFVAQLVQMTFMPAWMRSLPVILVLAAGPLVVLVYWMWRVRLRQNPTPAGGRPRLMSGYDPKRT
ncbi:MAG: DUF2306 domain-containing protein [Betaproteobacteria bacterium]|nr:DUF2306 domain-containing protein [Betaproteobacteria bacterium]MBV9359798.1 DUF2306 domain-containing protein [Betaproteobacteria bacterium]